MEITRITLVFSSELEIYLLYNSKADSAFLANSEAYAFIFRTLKIVGIFMQRDNKMDIIFNSKSFC